MSSLVDIMPEIIFEERGCESSSSILNPLNSVISDIVNVSTSSSSQNLTIIGSDESNALLATVGTANSSNKVRRVNLAMSDMGEGKETFSAREFARKSLSVEHSVMSSFDSFFDIPTSPNTSLSAISITTLSCFIVSSSLKFSNESLPILSIGVDDVTVFPMIFN
jgi:hypothetical protein